MISFPKYTFITFITLFHPNYFPKLHQLRYFKFFPSKIHPNCAILPTNSRDSSWMKIDRKETIRRKEVEKRSERRDYKLIIVERKEFYFTKKEEELESDRFSTSLSNHKRKFASLDNNSRDDISSIPDITYIFRSRCEIRLPSKVNSRIFPSQEPGQLMYPGIHNVRYIASDAAGNRAECHFSIHVRGKFM